jgi:hypothetical protein
LAVNPAPFDTGSFSPLDTERFTCFFFIEDEPVVRELKYVEPERQAVQTAQ